MEVCECNMIEGPLQSWRTMAWLSQSILEVSTEGSALWLNRTSMMDVSSEWVDIGAEYPSLLCDVWIWDMKRIYNTYGCKVRYPLLLIKQGGLVVVSFDMF